MGVCGTVRGLSAPAISGFGRSKELHSGRSGGPPPARPPPPLLPKEAPGRGRVNRPPPSLRFPVGRGDLEAVAAVFTVHGHHRAVVQVLDQASGHSAPRLTHEVPALREEVKPLPGGGDQPCFTGRTVVLEHPPV